MFNVYLLVEKKYVRGWVINTSCHASRYKVVVNRYHEFENNI